MLDMFQKAFIHKSYVSASYVDEESIKKNEKYYGKIENINDENKKYIQLISSQLMVLFVRLTQLCR
jgi:hypothetical protein